MQHAISGQRAFAGAQVGSKRQHGSMANSRSRRAALSVRAEMITSKPTSGLEIKGLRPTSIKAWEEIATTLRRSSVTFVSRAQVAAAASKGSSTIIDVRPAGDYAKGRVPGAASAEFYRLIEGWEPAKVVRRVAFTFFGVIGTEYNPDFLEEVAAAAPDKSKPITLYCQIGGTLEPWADSDYGRQSRSLTAAYELLQAGYKSIQVMEGGYTEWAKEEREVEVDE